MAPLPVGTYSLRHACHDVVVSGRYAYVADGAVGIRILDVSGPAPVPLQVHAGSLSAGLAVALSLWLVSSLFLSLRQLV